MTASESETDEPGLPARAAIPRIVLALAIAALGGGLFAWAGLPLPFMLGAMAASALVAIAGWPVASPKAIRPPMAAVLGAMLGANFSAEIIAEMPRWIGPLAGLAAFTLASALASVTYLRRVAGYDAKTAYFAGMPGGLVDMAMIGEAMGADVRRIALVHATRIMVIVFTVPFLVRLFALADIPAIQRGAVSIFEVGPDFYLWFVGTCIVGAVLGHVARLPGKYMLGPMIVSALVHMMGWTDYRLPYELVIAAQIVLGAVVGCRFIGLGWRDVGGIVVAGLGSTLILLVLTLAFAFGLGPLTGMGGMSLFLAYSPGGFMEMGLVALAIGIDVAFVAASHLLRITLVGVFAPLAFKLMGIGGAGDNRE